MTFNYYLQKFFGLGSKKTVRHNERELLKRLVSCVPQTLTIPEQVQARENIGIHLMFKVGQITYLTKGEHYVPFTTPFTDPYIIIPYGTTGTSSFVPILDTNKFELNRFWVKMPVAGHLIWIAYVITEL